VWAAVYLRETLQVVEVKQLRNGVDLQLVGRHAHQPQEDAHGHQRRHLLEHGEQRDLLETPKERPLHELSGARGWARVFGRRGLLLRRLGLLRLDQRRQRAIRRRDDCFLL
jgi:hypothetical protein